MKLTTKLVAVGLLLLSFSASAQMPWDAIYLNKKLSCTALMYGRSTWTNYWENSLKRENFNIGTQTTQSVMLMSVYSISNRVNVIASVPYVWTNNSAGNLMGQKGIQDLSGWLKVKALNVGGLSLNAVVGGSIPLGNYVPDFLPMSIGLQCRTATGRLIANYRHQSSGLYMTASGSYIWRSNINVDRDAYQANDRVYNTNEVGVPNAYDGAVRLGILRKTWQSEVFAEYGACDGGDNIRRNDMPFPTNNMTATTVGYYGKYEPGKLGVNARVGYVVDGKNVGQSTSFMVGLLYQIQFK
jgi:hypothetical protein